VIPPKCDAIESIHCRIVKSYMDLIDQITVRKIKQKIITRLDHHCRMCINIFCIINDNKRAFQLLYILYILYCIYFIHIILYILYILYCIYYTYYTVYILYILYCIYYTYYNMYNIYSIICIIYTV
jgi:hypothetical protein